MASGLLEPDLRKIKEMAAGYGYRVRVIGYVRPLLDYIESAYQQSVRVGANLQIVDAINRVAGWLGFWNRQRLTGIRENDLTGNVLRRLNLLSLLPDPNFFPKWVAQEWNIRVHRRRLLNRWMQY
jgi:hypothetical protein